MPSRDDYVAVAQEIANYFNAFNLGFKTYKVSELDAMIKAKAGEGARISTKTAAEEFETVLLKRGFMCFPAIPEVEDGYVRVFRTGTVAANILQAFLSPGQTTDQSLAAMLRTLRTRRQVDDREEGEGVS
ncbi:MAG: hypothetical protein K2W85_07095 [Phycisphaerales bacterium]|nr:hypothetical protein [Phycisphaerales bacterium]